MAARFTSSTFVINERQQLLDDDGGTWDDGGDIAEGPGSRASHIAVRADYDGQEPVDDDGGAVAGTTAAMAAAATLLTLPSSS